MSASLSPIQVTATPAPSTKPASSPGRALLGLLLMVIAAGLFWNAHEQSVTNAAAATRDSVAREEQAVGRLNTMFRSECQSMGGRYDAGNCTSR